MFYDQLCFSNYFWIQIHILVEKVSSLVLALLLVFKWVSSEPKKCWISVYYMPLFLLFSMRISEHSMLKTHRPSHVLNTCQQVLKGCG